MVYDLKFTLIWERASIHVGCKWRRYKSNRKFLPRWFRYGLSLSFSWFTSQYSEGINFDWLNVWICWTLASKTLVWTRITQDLRNGGPLEMLSIAKPIEIKVLLHQFSLLMFNLHYIFLFTVFLPDRSISVLPLFLGKCRTAISSRGPKSAKKENKKNTKTLWELSFRHAFYLVRVVRIADIRFAWLFYLAYLRLHVLRAYCDCDSK